MPGYVTKQRVESYKHMHAVACSGKVPYPAIDSIQILYLEPALFVKIIHAKTIGNTVNFLKIKWIRNGKGAKCLYVLQ